VCISVKLVLGSSRPQLEQRPTTDAYRRQIEKREARAPIDLNSHIPTGLPTDPRGPLSLECSESAITDESFRCRPACSGPPGGVIRADGREAHRHGDDHADERVCDAAAGEPRGAALLPSHVEDARPIVAAFEAVGTSRPVTLPLEEKKTLLVLVEDWLEELGRSIEYLPEGVWGMRDVLHDHLDVRRPNVTRRPGVR
jgi:hypothetical protein